MQQSKQDQNSKEKQRKKRELEIKQTPPTPNNLAEVNFRRV